MRIYIENYAKPAKIFEIDISECYRFSENMAYFLVPIVNSSTSNYQKLLTQLQMIKLYQICVIRYQMCYMISNVLYDIKHLYKS